MRAGEGSVLISPQNLAGPAADEWAQLERIYLASFPPGERDPFGEIVAAVQQGALQLWVARVAATGEIVGLAIAGALPQSGLMYLAYLAVEESWRNRGVGAALFRFLADEAARVAGARGLLWEVQPERSDDPGHIQNRRLRFYQRLGGRLVRCAPHYRMPNLAGEGTIPLRLMWLPLAQGLDEPDRQTVAAWVGELYALYYPQHLRVGREIIAGML